MYFKKMMGLVRERLDFDREGTALQKIGVGHKRPGQPKSFEDAQKGDTTIDYNGFEGELLDKMIITFGPDGRPTEEGDNFVGSYDSTGVSEDMWEMEVYEEGDTMEIIATLDSDDDSLVWDYGPDGSYAIW